MAGGRAVVRFAVGPTARPTAGLRPSAPSVVVGPAILAPLIARAALPTLARRVVVAVIGLAVLAAPLARIPVLVFGLGPALAAVVEVAPPAVADAAAAVAAQAPPTRVRLVALAIGTVRRLPARNRPMAAVRLVEAA